MSFDRSGLENRERVFLDLTLEALRELEKVIDRPGFVPCFRVWEYSPNKAYRSWLIQVPEGGAPGEWPPLVIEQTWDVIEDRERLDRDLRRRHRFEPSMKAREARLPKQEFDVLRGLASHLQLPLIELRESHVSVQTAEFGLEGYRPGASRLRSEAVKVEWGAEPASGLKAITAWARQIRELCKKSFSGVDAAHEQTGRCPVCTKGVTGLPVKCQTCKVQYHLECWGYIGQCAIYGCGGTEAL